MDSIVKRLLGAVVKSSSVSWSQPKDPFVDSTGEGDRNAEGGCLCPFGTEDP